jgi:t-SNARE complex subunit (syntaxin)
MATIYNIYKHEAKDYPKTKLFLYGIFFAIIIITMILTVMSFNFG